MRLPAAAVDDDDDDDDDDEEEEEEEEEEEDDDGFPPFWPIAADRAEPAPVEPMPPRGFMSDIDGPFSTTAFGSLTPKPPAACLTSP